MRTIPYALLKVCLLLGVLSGCQTTTTSTYRDVNKAISGLPTPIIPDGTIQLTPKHSVTISQLAAGMATWYAIKWIYDPLAPNWEIEEERLSEDTFRYSMKMKRYHRGGSGESMQVLRRRVTQVQQELGYSSYQLMEYSEGIDSQTLGARRYAEGLVRLTQPQGEPPRSMN